jgi:hypothetical protein
MHRRLLLIDPSAQSWRLEALHVETLEKDPREDYFVLSGEALCQYLLRRDPGTLVIARGPMPFLSGNKASVGYVSPLTGVPHYSASTPSASEIWQVLQDLSGLGSTSW